MRLGSLPDKGKSKHGKEGGHHHRHRENRCEGRAESRKAVAGPLLGTISVYFICVWCVCNYNGGGCATAEMKRDSRLPTQWSLSDSLCQGLLSPHENQPLRSIAFHCKLFFHVSFPFSVYLHIHRFLWHLPFSVTPGQGPKQKKTLTPNFLVLCTLVSIPISSAEEKLR